MKNILFVCSQNRWRSPTAEQVFADWPGIETASAGTHHGADQELSAELLAWANIVFVMEAAHRRRIQTRFRAALEDTRLICLDIPDRYGFMDPELVALLKAKVERFLPARPG